MSRDEIRQARLRRQRHLDPHVVLSSCSLHITRVCSLSAAALLRPSLRRPVRGFRRSVRIARPNGASTVTVAPDVHWQRHPPPDGAAGLGAPRQYPRDISRRHFPRAHQLAHTPAPRLRRHGAHGLSSSVTRSRFEARTCASGRTAAIRFMKLSTSSSTVSFFRKFFRTAPSLARCQTRRHLDI